MDLISAACWIISAAECLYCSIFSRATFLASNKSISDWRFAYQIQQFSQLEMFHSTNKVGRVFPMVIWSEFRLGKYRDDDHREDAAHFSMINLYF